MLRHSTRTRWLAQAGVGMLFCGAFLPALAQVTGQSANSAWKKTDGGGATNAMKSLQLELHDTGMVVIPGGEFMMGASPDDLAGLSSDTADSKANTTKAESAKAKSWISSHAAPRHRVTVASFALGKHDVTRGEYARFVQETGYVGMGCLVGPPWKDSPSADWHSPGFAQTDNDPVVCVSYEDAQAYLAWFSNKRGHTYRLPTEAEWEYAARAGTTTAFWWGTDDSAECRYANAADKAFSARFPEDAANQNCDDGYVFTAPVGSFHPSPRGLYDMSGNAWQIVADCWNVNYDGAPGDGSASASGDCTKRVVRGGSWNSYPANLRVANRNRMLSPRDSRATFRLARTLP